MLLSIHTNEHESKYCLFIQKWYKFVGWNTRRLQTKQLPALDPVQLLLLLLLLPPPPQMALLHMDRA